MMAKAVQLMLHLEDGKQCLVPYAVSLALL